jgi:hypothetical protein
MARCLVALCMVVLIFSPLSAQLPADTLRPSADTVFVIPGGPVAGTLTANARATVLDTIAGWAKIQIEGWVPVQAVAGRLEHAAPKVTGNGKTLKSGDGEQQCEALTKKGTRCKRKAMPGSRYCWQHQNYDK